MTLNLDHLSYIYRGRPILNSVTANIPCASLTCLLGSNGAGKTTLLRIISGELEATSGTFLVGDTNGSTISQKELAHYFSIIPQGIQSPSHFTVIELVNLGRFRKNRAFRWRLSTRDHEIVDEALRKCNANQFSERRMRELSQGEQQRVWLAFTLAQEKDYLLLDETLDDLDVLNRRTFFQLIKEVAAAGKGVLLTTHDLGLVTEFADQIIVLNNGKISYEGPPQGDISKFLCSPE